jgi:D-3-phosphoglycerate dehydrogenase
MNFIENGNIVNSVNYPNCDMGVCKNAGRVTVCHKNVPNMISRFTAVFAQAGANISDMLNKSRGDYAYTMIDTDTAVSADLVSQIEAIDGVIKARVIK